MRKILAAVSMVLVLLCSTAPPAWAVDVGLTARDDLLGVSFAGPKKGWACGRRGIVLHTGDGGLSWMRQQTGTDYTLTSIFFVDSENGWAVGDEGTILHTKDGGNTWVRQKSPATYYLMDVCFVSPLSGWIVTERTHILHTEDGGEHWAIQYHDKDFVLKAVSFVDSLIGWTVGEYGSIYHTRDGGATWQQQAGFYRLSEETDEIEGGHTLFDVAAVDAQTAFAAGIDGYVCKTTDGGRSWKSISTPAPRTQLFCVTTDRKGTVVIGGRGVFLASRDGGETWIAPRFEPPIAWGWIYGSAWTGRDFVAVGWQGSIYRNAGDLLAWRRIIP